MFQCLSVSDSTRILSSYVLEHMHLFFVYISAPTNKNRPSSKSGLKELERVCSSGNNGDAEIRCYILGMLSTLLRPLISSGARYEEHKDVPIMPLPVGRWPLVVDIARLTHLAVCAWEPYLPYDSSLE